MGELVLVIEPGHEPGLGASVRTAEARVREQGDDLGQKLRTYRLARHEDVPHTLEGLEHLGVPEREEISERGRDANQHRHAAVANGVDEGAGAVPLEKIGGRAHEESAEQERLGRAMRQWSEQEEVVGRVVAGHQLRHQDRRHLRIPRIDDSLRQGGRAGRVDDHVFVGLPWRDDLGRAGRCLLVGRSDRERVDLGEYALNLYVVTGRVVVDDEAEACVPEDVPELAPAVAVVDGDGRNSRLVGCDVALHPFGAVGAEDADALLGRDVCLQETGERLGAPVELRERDRPLAGADRHPFGCAPRTSSEELRHRCDFASQHVSTSSKLLSTTSHPLRMCRSIADRAAELSRAARAARISSCCCPNRAGDPPRYARSYSSRDSLPQ